MKQLFVRLAIIAGICIGGPAFAPFAAQAESYPASVIETGITEGFAAPTLYFETEQLTALLAKNRTLKKPYLINFSRQRGKIFARITTSFMTEMISKQAAAFGKVADPYDNSTKPWPGYTWQMKIFHPGSIAGMLAPSTTPYHVIVFCAGAGKSGAEFATAMDWLGTYYAQKGYIVAVPVLICNDENLNKAPYYEIATDIHVQQVRQTIDYVQQHFDNATDTDNVTLIGHSLSGYTTQKTAAQDLRIRRLCLLSSVFIYQPSWPGFLIDAVDLYDLLNTEAGKRGMALHVQRFTGPPRILGCPGYDPECDWTPPVDGFIARVDISRDRWQPHLCAGEPCGRQDGTLYNYGLYEGPKQDAIRNNNLLTHSSMYDPKEENNAGRTLMLQYLDEFFEQFPVK